MQVAEEAEAIERILFCFCTATAHGGGAPAAAVDFGYLSPAGCRCNAGQEDNTVLRLSAFSYSILFLFCSVARTVSFEFLWLWPSHFWASLREHTCWPLCR